MEFKLLEDVIARWPAAEASHVDLLRAAGVNFVLTARPPAEFEQACRASRMDVLPPAALPALDLAAYAAADPAKPSALKEGLWPGVTQPPSAGSGDDDDIASASREPWVDANGFWVMWLRAMFPRRPALLAYEAEVGDRLVPYESLELALIEARVSGGNYVLDLEPRFRKALLAGDAKAQAAWTSLGRTAAWLRENRAFFGAPPPPTITVLVEGGHETPEIANLAYRRIVSPALARVADPPPPDPARCLELVAANLKPPAPAVRARILAHAEAGAIVVVASDPQNAWWRDTRLKLIKPDEDRDIFRLGKGQVVAYKAPIDDPSEFGLDMIDLVSHRRRPVRIWNAPAVIAFVTGCPRGAPLPGAALLHLVNYGSPMDSDFPARVQGHFSRATLVRPEAAPLTLKTARRGSTTEVFVPELLRLGVVVFG